MSYNPFMNLEELRKLAATLHPNWKIETIFVQSEDWGRGMHVCRIMEPAAGFEFVKAHAKNKDAATAARDALEDALGEAGKDPASP